MRGHPKHAISGAFDELCQECARAVLAIGMHQIAELVVHHWLTGEATVFQTGIIVIAPSQEKFTGSASACGAYTYKTAVRWPRGLRRRFAKALPGITKRAGIFEISARFLLGTWLALAAR